MLQTRGPTTQSAYSGGLESARSMRCAYGERARRGVVVLQRRTSLFRRRPRFHLSVGSRAPYHRSRSDGNDTLDAQSIHETDPGHRRTRRGARGCVAERGPARSAARPARPRSPAAADAHAARTAAAAAAVPGPRGPGSASSRDDARRAPAAAPRHHRPRPRRVSRPSAPEALIRGVAPRGRSSCAAFRPSSLRRRSLSRRPGWARTMPDIC